MEQLTEVDESAVQSAGTAPTVADGKVTTYAATVADAPSVPDCASGASVKVALPLPVFVIVNVSVN